MRPLLRLGPSLTAVLALTALLSGCHHYENIDKSQILATVNGERITEQDYRDYLRARDLQEPPLTRNRQSKQIILNELINRVILAQAALKRGLNRRPDVYVALKEDRENILARAMLKHYLAHHHVSSKELHALYQKEILGAPHREYEARHILVATKAEAQRILRELHHGARFSVLARRDSLDVPSGRKGGGLGWFSASDVLPSFYHALVQLHVGEVSPKPIKTRFGWHIVQLQAERPYTPPPFSAVREQLYRSAEQRDVDDMMATMRSKSQIHLVEPHNNPT
ncbi:MAG TPA: peptidylprolyl isomerase [Acidiferrobacter sp.]|nr:peptidylprolyl isomerase [Acidiferrobacter sp.]